MSVQLLRRKFTIAQYHKMAESGIINESDRVELIQGEIVEMASIGRRHAACVSRINQKLTIRLGERAIVWPQNPVELNDNSEPQPDVALLQPRSDFYEAEKPQAQDIILIIEVADTTVEADRNVKIPLYAENGIMEVWLVDINAECVEVYRELTPNGYQQLQRFQRGQTLSIQAFPDVAIAIDEILG